MRIIRINIFVFSYAVNDTDQRNHNETLGKENINSRFIWALEGGHSMEQPLRRRFSGPMFRTLGKTDGFALG